MVPRNDDASGALEEERCARGESVHAESTA